ncbi:MAG: heteromeric transposase endonuclease subunit TnsA [Deltaproteobacteria bacterium]|nr:heteromeric transposase endonuclease subunit TnsA [Deltaproteobacteria bacterium]
MAAKKHGNLEKKNQKWIKEGRGTGRGKSYKPWLTVRDLASSGRSHRLFGHKSQRTHHLFSDLELSVFLLLEWHIDTEEIREQFPLRLEETTVLATAAGIAHPSFQGSFQIMSSDFLVNTRDKSRPIFSLQAKYSKDLQNARTVEKLELERRYWLQKDVPWMLITEKDIPKVLFENIKWLYAAQSNESSKVQIPNRVDFFCHHFNKKPDDTIFEIAKALDIAYEQEPGENLREIRYLLSTRCFLFDFTIPFRKLKASDLQVANVPALLEGLRVSSQ